MSKNKPEICCLTKRKLSILFCFARFDETYVINQSTEYHSEFCNRFEPEILRETGPHAKEDRAPSTQHLQNDQETSVVLRFKKLIFLKGEKCNFGGIAERRRD